MTSEGWDAGDVREVRLADGRRVSLLDIGARDGKPVVALHGTPGSGMKFRAADAAATEAGVRLIAPDRWGYGGTDAPRQPALGLYAADLAGLADGLGIGRFGLFGISGGGPFAAVAAGLLGQRITRTALVCPVGPLFECPPGTIDAFHRMSFLILPLIPGATRLTFAAYRALVTRAPGLAVRMAMARAPVSDRAAMSDPGTRHDLAVTFAAGLTHSAAGPVIDMALFSRPWRPSGLPDGGARVWIGTADRNVPVGAARALAECLRAELVEVERAGHYWIARAWPEVIGWLAEG